MPTVLNLRPARSSDLGDGLLEPAERLGWHRSIRERDDVGADGGVELLEKFLAPAVLVPCHQHVSVHREAGPGSPEGERRLFPVMVDDHPVAAVECPFRHRVEQSERRDDGTSGQYLDLEVASSHVIDLLGEIERKFVKDILGRPSALPPHVTGPLGLDNIWRGNSCGSADGGDFQEMATRLSRPAGAFMPEILAFVIASSSRGPLIVTGSRRIR